MYSLEQIANMLETAQRCGQWPDRDRLGATGVAPRPAEVHDKYVKLSDRLAREIAAALRHHARGENPRAVALERRNGA